MVMDNNNFNKKQKLEHGSTETNLEGGINISTGMSVTVATINVNLNQSNASTVDVCDSGERKSCAHTKTTLQAYEYGCYQLREFLGGDCPTQ